MNRRRASPIYRTCASSRPFGRAQPPRCPLSHLWRSLLTPVVFSGREAVVLALAATAIGFVAAQLATARAPPPDSALPSHATQVTGTLRAVGGAARGPAW